MMICVSMLVIDVIFKFQKDNACMYEILFKVL